MAKRSDARPPIKRDVAIERGGKEYRGSYYVSGGLLTLDCEFGSKSANPGAAPEVIAKIILRELVQEAELKGWLK